MPRTAQVILRAWRREHLNLILCRFTEPHCCYPGAGRIEAISKSMLWCWFFICLIFYFQNPCMGARLMSGFG